MRTLVVVLLLTVSAFALTEQQYQDAFLQWMRTYSKTYQHDTFHYRYEIFKQNVDFVNSWNTRGLHQVALNGFADLAGDEFGRYFNGYNMPANGAIEGPTFVPGNTSALPASYDWRTEGAVTHIKNQEQCGSCWSFSTTGSTEGCHKIKGGTLTPLSEQNLMDCSTSYGNEGCEGGLMTQAMRYIIHNHGIDTEASYPYTAEDGTSCGYKAADSGATLTAYSNVASGNEDDLQASVYKGPTSVAIDASHSSFQFYSSGVYYEPDCSSSQLDHGVLAIGWGSASSGTHKTYWIVKNSWGTDWGQSGYIWMARNADNNCGIATMATLPEC